MIACKTYHMNFSLRYLQHVTVNILVEDVNKLISFDDIGRSLCLGAFYTHGENLKVGFNKRAEQEIANLEEETTLEVC